MNDFIEFTGKSTEEALRNAESHFSLPLGRLEVEVISAGSSGFFGLLGAKKAKVRVRPLAGSGMEQEMAELAAVVSDSHRSQDPRPTAQPSSSRPQFPVFEDDGQNTQIKPIRPNQPQEEPPSQPLPENQLETVKWGQKPGHAPADDGLEMVTWTAEPASATPAALDDAEADDAEAQDETEGVGDQRLGEDSEVLAHALEVLTRLVIPLDATATVTAQSGPQGIELAVQGQETGVFIGRRGQTLEALQYIVTRIVNHRYGRPLRIVVDAGEYRHRRREALEALAQRMAATARQNGRAVAVGPLSAQERRIVHMALKGKPDLTTSSHGRGELKKVVISPGRPGAPGGA
ncbi:spoIIIJ-associated protein [Desulfarculales bacterium]